MSELETKFEELKKMLVYRASSALGEAGLKMFLSLLDGYHDELLRSLKACEKNIADVKDENSMLRGIAGVSDPEVMAKLVSQAEEIRFLREEVLLLRKNNEGLDSKLDSASVEIERLKRELAASFNSRGSDQKTFDKGIEDIGAGMKNYEEKLKTTIKEFEAKKAEYEEKLSSIVREIDSKSLEYVKNAVIRLRNVCVGIEEAGSVFKQEMENLKSSLKSVKKKGFSFGTDKSNPVNILAPALPSFNLLQERVDEASNVLRLYMEAFAPAEIKATKMNWSKFFDDLKNKYSVQSASKRLKISWPGGKMPAEFICDQVLLSKAFGAVIENSIEALPVEGTIEINIEFTGSSAAAMISDSGREIKPENREMLFTPLFTTKSSHYGLGLVSCRKILRNLGGDAAYEPSKTGNTFKLTFSSVENTEIKK